MKINIKKWAHAINADTVAIEICGNARTAQKNFNEGLFNCWTPERIKSAFNFNNGTIADLKKYAKRNKQFCTIIFL